jgi:hypothetical protein
MYGWAASTSSPARRSEHGDIAVHGSAAVPPGDAWRIALISTHVPAARSHAPDPHSRSVSQLRQSWLAPSQTGVAMGQLALVRHTAQVWSTQTGVSPLQSSSPLQPPSGGPGTSAGRGKSQAAASARAATHVSSATILGCGGRRLANVGLTSVPGFAGFIAGGFLPAAGCEGVKSRVIAQIRAAAPIFGRIALSQDGRAPSPRIAHTAPQRRSDRWQDGSDRGDALTSIGAMTRRRSTVRG